MALISGPRSDVYFTGEESGLLWEECLFELQDVVEWRVVRESTDALHELPDKHVRRHVWSRTHRRLCEMDTAGQQT